MAMRSPVGRLDALNKSHDISPGVALNKSHDILPGVALKKCPGVLFGAPLVITSGVYQIRNGRPVLVRPLPSNQPAAPEGGAA